MQTCVKLGSRNLKILMYLLFAYLLLSRLLTSKNLFCFTLMNIYLLPPVILYLTQIYHTKLSEKVDMRLSLCRDLIEVNNKNEGGK